MTRVGMSSAKKTSRCAALRPTLRRNFDGRQVPDDFETGRLAATVAPSTATALPLRIVDRHVQQALQAIDLAEASAPVNVEVTAEHARRIAELMQLSENQNGADKSWLWPAYEFVRRHFANARPI